MENCKFTYFYSISFNNKYFVVLYNAKYNLYILEINENGDIMYPKYEDYSKYYKLHHKQLLNIVYNISSGNNTFQKFPNNILKIIEDFKKRFKNGIKITPKVIRDGSIILLASAMIFLSGCAEKDIPKEEISDKTSTESREEMEFQEIEYQQYGEITIPYLHSTYDDNIKKHIIYCKNIDEFKSHIEMGNSPTYEDIINAFQENSEIHNEIKGVIIEELHRMKKEFPDLDLSILYYNAKRMKTILSDSDEMKRKGMESSACFIANTGEVYFSGNEKVTDFTVAHEILGHGSTEAVFQDSKKVVYSGFIANVAQEVDGKYYSKAIGNMLVEGVADIIAEKTSNQKQESTYNMGKEAFRIISELNGQTISETINSRGWNLYKNMYESGNINNPVNYIMYLDTLYQDWMSGNLVLGEQRLSDFFRILVFDSMDEKIAKEGATCIEKTNDIFEKNTYFPEGIELWYYSDKDKTKKTVIEKYNPYQISEMVKEKIKETMDENLNDMEYSDTKSER